MLATSEQAESLLRGASERNCTACGTAFVGFLSPLCDPCVEKERAKHAATTRSSFRFDKTFPQRAIRDTRTMRGPAMAKAKEILPLIRKPGQGAILVVLGDRCTGKTVMATWWAGMLGYGRYVKAFDLFAELRRTYHEDSKTKEHEVLAKYRDANFLVIDEAQDRKESEWEQTILTNLIDKRYDALRPTVIIANLKLDGIDACLGASIISRCIRTGGGIIECTWPPYSG
jgi:DNA replication protein DnaC